MENVWPPLRCCETAFRNVDIATQQKSDADVIARIPNPLNLRAKTRRPETRAWCGFAKDSHCRATRFSEHLQRNVKG